jgi:hypothetical protein
MERNRHTAAVILLLGAWTALSQAAAPAPREQLLDEARVEATRTQLRQMRLQMVAVENRFYDQYNALNGNDNYDIHCAEETTAGTRLRNRHCRPVFEAKAVETESTDYFIMLQNTTNAGAPVPAGSIGPPMPAIMAIEAQRPDFRKNMIEITTRHPQLLNLLKERDKLARRYNTARRKAAKKNISEIGEAGAAQAP